MIKLFNLFETLSSDLFVNFIIKNEFAQSNEFVGKFKEDPEEFENILNGLGYEGFDVSWKQWYCRIISGDLNTPERRIYTGPDGKHLRFDDYLCIIKKFPTHHVKNTVELMNKLKIASVNRGIEDIASAAIKMAVLLKLYESYENSNTLKTIEYHVCKMFENKE